MLNPDTFCSENLFPFTAINDFKFCSSLRFKFIVIVIQVNYASHQNHPENNS